MIMLLPIRFVYIQHVDDVVNILQSRSRAHRVVSFTAEYPF